MSSSAADVDSRRFRRLTFNNRARSNKDLVLNGAYGGQIAGYERDRMVEKSKERHLKLRNANAWSDSDLQQTIDYFSGQRALFIRDVEGYPTLSGLGSARCISELGEAIVDRLSAKAVPRSLGIATGKWAFGWMGAYARNWLEKKAEYEPDVAFSVAYPLLGQEFNACDDPNMPEWFRTFRENKVSPPYAAFPGRTPDILFGTQNCGNVYGEPGEGTAEEFGRSRLERQMRTRNLTVYSDRISELAVPADMILDTPRQDKPSEWTWDYVLHQYAGMVGNGTVSMKDLAGLYVLRVGKKADSATIDTPVPVEYFDTPDELSDFVMQQAWICHEAYRADINAQTQAANGA